MGSAGARGRRPAYSTRSADSRSAIRRVDWSSTSDKLWRERPKSGAESVKIVLHSAFDLLPLSRRIVTSVLDTSSANAILLSRTACNLAGWPSLATPRRSSHSCADRAHLTDHAMSSCATVRKPIRRLTAQVGASAGRQFRTPPGQPPAQPSEIRWSRERACRAARTRARLIVAPHHARPHGAWPSSAVCGRRMPRSAVGGPRQVYADAMIPERRHFA